MYSHKSIDYGFVILCPEHAVNLLKCTANSIKTRYKEIPYICATDNSANTEDLKEMKAICPTYKGKNTFSSLINIGMKNAPAEWNFIICAGANVTWGISEKFAYFIESENDVLFPIADKKYNFIEATLNGLLINKKTWKMVGPMENEGEIEMVKAIWGCKALEKGVQFKAIAGAKIC